MAFNLEGAAQGAAGGAAAGTAVLPGWGTAIGGILGGVGGLGKQAPPPDPMVALTGFTTPQVVGASVVGVVLLLVAVR